MQDKSCPNKFKIFFIWKVVLENKTPRKNPQKTTKKTTTKLIKRMPSII